MRVLILSQYFAPELTAAAARVHTFSARLAALGHTVHVICEVPNHPRGVIADGYGQQLFDRRSLDGFDVTYVWVSTNSVKTTRSRIAGYGSFALMASIAGVGVRRPDVVFASSPPLTVGVAARVLAVTHRVPWVLDVRDMWPAAAVAVGELRGKRVLQAATRLEQSLYRSASAITTPSERSRAEIAATGIHAGKVHLITSGTTQEWLDLGDTVVGRVELGLPAGDFIWTYAGNVGLAQDVGTAIRAAAELGEGYRLLVVGDGPLRGEMEQLAAQVAPEGVRFTGLVSRELAGRYMRASDAVLVSLANAPGLEYAVPSKLYDCCAVGRPVIVAAAGEARRLSEKHGIALTVAPGDSTSLAAAVRHLRGNHTAGITLVEAARVFAKSHLRDTQAERLVEVLRSVVS
jgi:colanic acid biosynthesis glycosyl transferase WcaI